MRLTCILGASGAKAKSPCLDCRVEEAYALGFRSSGILRTLALCITAIGTLSATVGQLRWRLEPVPACRAQTRTPKGNSSAFGEQRRIYGMRRARAKDSTGSRTTVGRHDIAERVGSTADLGRYCLRAAVGELGNRSGYLRPDPMALRLNRLRVGRGAPE